jgi:CcmD family protein
MDKRNFEFLFYGFTAAWLIVFAYVLTLLRRSSRLRGELKRLEAISGATDHACPTRTPLPLQ